MFCYRYLTRNLPMGKNLERYVTWFGKLTMDEDGVPDHTNQHIGLVSNTMYWIEGWFEDHAWYDCSCPSDTAASVHVVV